MLATAPEIVCSVRHMAGRADIDPETRERIAAWLRYYLADRGWTRQQLADRLGLSEPTITNIVNGKRTPGLDVVIRMHRKLGRSADNILDDPPPTPKRK